MQADTDMNLETAVKALEAVTKPTDEILGLVHDFEEQIRTSKQLAKDAEDFLEKLKACLVTTSEAYGDVEPDEALTWLQKQMEGFELRLDEEAILRTVDALQELLDSQSDGSLRKKLTLFAENVRLRNGAGDPHELARQVMFLR